MNDLSDADARRELQRGPPPAHRAIAAHVSSRAHRRMLNTAFISTSLFPVLALPASLPLYRPTPLHHASSALAAARLATLSTSLSPPSQPRTHSDVHLR